MNQDQYLQFIQSPQFTSQYISALQGNMEQRVDNDLALQYKNTLTDEGMSKFARERGYDQLFTQQMSNVIQQPTNRGNNIELANATEHMNPVKAMLFSQKNIDFLQQKCIEEIYYKTNKKYLISPQDYMQVLQIITHVYNDISIPNYYATVGSPEFKQEISYLNAFILKELCEYTYNSLLNYISYSEFLANGIQPIDRPTNVSSKGTNTLITM